MGLKITKRTVRREITEQEFKKQKTYTGYKNLRQVSKQLNFLMLFGGGAKMFAENALETAWTPEEVEDYVKTIDPSILQEIQEKYSKLSDLKQKYIAVAQVMKNGFFDAYPELLERIDRELEYAKKHGFCRSNFGSTRKFIELALEGSYDKKYLSKVMDNLGKISSNYKAQNYEACITKRVMYEMQNWLEKNNKKSKLFNEIHDSIDVYIYKSEINEVLSHLQHLAERKIPEVKDTWVPLVIDCEIADLADKNHNDTYKHGRAPIEFGIKDWDNFKYEDPDPFNVELYEEAEKEYFEKRAKYWKEKKVRDPLSSKIKEYLNNKYGK